MRACVICGAAFEATRANRVSCSKQCIKNRRLEQESIRRKEVRREKRVGRACGDCGTSIAAYTMAKKYCEPCIEKRDLAVQRRIQDQKRQERSVADRTCLDCKVSISRRRADAVRCKECVRKGKLAANVERLRVRRAAAGAQSKAKKPTTTKAAQPTTAAPKRERVHREKPAAMRKPNLDGDWFPGWRGQYPSRYTDDDIARIERGRQLLVNDDKTRHQDREGRTYRYSDFGNDHPIYPEERAS